jgi:hypothetical protein
MIANKLDFIHEQTSPLFRLMWSYNITEPARRQFDNNICAFHIGNGFVLSVAHNIKIESQILKSTDEAIFQADILPHLNPTQVQLFNRCYFLDPVTKKRYVNITDQADIQPVIDTFKQINFDTRWLTLTQRNFCKPFLIVQFKSNQYYNDAILTTHFNKATYFHEPSLNRHTFLLEVELVEAFYKEDIALYRIINTQKSVIDRLPCVKPDFSILEDNQSNLYCVQSSPNGFLGRLINKAIIEGFIDHHGIFQDRIGGNYIFEGTRYLIKGYFRFGSSGAPYVFYDPRSRQYKVNAIQSEASPIQLSIGNNKEGNFQYVNAIASPLNIVQDRLGPYISPW